MQSTVKEYPTQATLNKYGLTREDMRRILEAQGYVCPICEKTPSTGRWVIDHQHVKNYKKLPAEKRKLYVRGVTCWFCNRNYLAKAIERTQGTKHHRLFGGLCPTTRENYLTYAEAVVNVDADGWHMTPITD